MTSLEKLTHIRASPRASRSQRSRNFLWGVRHRKKLRQESTRLIAGGLHEARDG
ncbi:hypothetical protein M7I_7741 [Glarea lozoyensis 74030]|uniref:Uncharacterized protein n=1 Tax=Glarea lozoyensis (strain ATCC 74030 / MF5533) TaxID=1104152 RepID=H0EY44_GLAL7|nr:hypothetical protein M7I_7741 [Glarea lozoyensis 74030]